MSKHSPTNIGWLDEEKYQKELWHYTPLTDFWQIGRGTAKRLAKYRIFNMHDIAFCDTKILYKEFGINAELLIDHAWGRETCTIADIKSYKPQSTSISSSQVLFKDYTYDKALLVLKEMVELKSLELVRHKLTTNSISLYIGYSKDVIKPTGGMAKLHIRTNTYTELVEAFQNLYIRTTNPNTLIRRIGISFDKIQSEGLEQLSLFSDLNLKSKERNLEKAVSLVKSKMGLNAIFKGMNLEQGATTMIRNKLIGGHNAE